jgi:hypothetical protein
VSTVTDLVERIRAALNETERVARAVTAEGWHEDIAKPEGWNEYDEAVREHIVAHDPERELRMVAAHRKILDECVRTLEHEDYGHWLANQTLTVLAKAYGVEA